MFSEINQMLRASVPIFVAAVARIAVPATAFARTVYDGDWGVLILRRGGACEPAVRCGVQITDGMVIYGGGMALLMTAAAMIVGMIPMAIGGPGEEQNAVLARAVLGGVAVGTMTTLFFVPFLYSIIGRFERLEAKVPETPARHGSA